MSVCKLLGVISLVSASSRLARGAGVTFDEYEADDGTTNGVLLAPNHSIGSFSSESSGRRSVRLGSKGQYVEIKSAQKANSVVVRYSIPDAPQGNGANASLSLYINGAFRVSLNLTSRFSWVYGGWDIPYSKDPSNGSAHHFFDETRVPPALAGSIPSGSTIRLQVDEQDNAAFYIIDLLDLELVSSPNFQPAHSLSITTFGGAYPNDGVDDRAAIQSTIDAAQSRGMSVWIPEGRFEVGPDGDLSLGGNVAIFGAGMWYSTVCGNTRFQCLASNCSYQDFAILGMATNRDGPANGFYNGAGRGSRLTNIWVEHTSVGYWVGHPRKPDQPVTTDLVISGCRFPEPLRRRCKFVQRSEQLCGPALSFSEHWRRQRRIMGPFLRRGEQHWECYQVQHCPVALASELLCAVWGTGQQY
jgi:hypothetical protein